MGTYSDRSSWRRLEIDRTDDGLISFTVARSTARQTWRETVLLTPTHWLFFNLMKEIPALFGRGVPSSADDTIGANFSSAQEDRFGAALTRAGVRFQRSPTTRLERTGSGKWAFCYPDFVIGSPAWVAVFFDGCYFHGCPDHFPHSARAQHRRDVQITKALIRNGWAVHRIWEHEDFDTAAARVADAVAARSASHTPQEEGMTKTETLIASLAASAAHGVDNLDGGGYIDWSTRDGDLRAVEVYNGQSDAIQLWMTTDQLRALHTQLTLTLLADKD